MRLARKLWPTWKKYHENHHLAPPGGGIGNRRIFPRLLSFSTVSPCKNDVRASPEPRNFSVFESTFDGIFPGAILIRPAASAEAGPDLGLAGSLRISAKVPSGSDRVSAVRFCGKGHLSHIDTCAESRAVSRAEAGPVAVSRIYLEGEIRTLWAPNSETQTPSGLDV